MSTILIVVHVTVSVALIMIVLLQTGKGADMGAAFGGGSSQTLFGSTGASTFLSKATTGAAIIFMLTSLALAYLSTIERRIRSCREPRRRLSSRHRQPKARPPRRRATRRLNRRRQPKGRPLRRKATRRLPAQSRINCAEFFITA